jgi:nicotinamide riboside kinase
MLGRKNTNLKKPVRIVLTGVESSGKSSLAKELSMHFNLSLVDEYAREYLQDIKTNYVQSDLTKIAKGQIEKISNHTEKLIICDTDLQVIKVWSMVKYNIVDDYILNEYEKSKASLYILCDPDFPWEYDELRENEFDRNKVHELYLTELNTNKLNYIIAKGSIEERKKYCVDCITKQFSTYL